MKARGFTVLEVAVSAALFGVVTAAVMGFAMTGQQQYTSSQHTVHASARATDLAERMISELRAASIEAEGFLNEDGNSNGRIDDDWSLADGASAETITFNKAEGFGRFSNPITFAFANGRLTRESGPVGSRETAILADDVTAVTFTRQGSRIVINVITVSGVPDDGETGSGRGGDQVSLVREVTIRN